VHYHSDQAGGEKTLAAIAAAGGAARLLRFDIADRAATRAVIEADIAAHGPYWGAVLNAGIARDTAFPAMTEGEWDDVLGTNLDGFYNVLHPLVMPMVSARKGGRIVTLSSVSGLVGNRGQVNYSAAKAGIIGATKALALELAKRAITVNCVAPGVVETQMVADLPMDEVMKMVPMRRLGKAEEVAGVVSFLCSDDARYVTRQVISVNGGMI
jgi:3-oxoacyl-[acyl-carrier protein] reductase